MIINWKLAKENYLDQLLKVKTHSHRPKVTAKAKIFFDVWNIFFDLFRLFFDLFCFHVRFWLVWMGP